MVLFVRAPLDRAGSRSVFIPLAIGPENSDPLPAESHLHRSQTRRMSPEPPPSAANGPTTATARERSAQIQHMLQTMLQLQEGHNVLVAADWRERNLPFNRAIWVECAELLDHFGWKWWKRQRPDLGQVHLEIVDIWHFGLSCLMQDADTELRQIAAAFVPLYDREDHEQYHDQLGTQPSTVPAPGGTANAEHAAERFRTCVEQLARNALDNTFNVEHFVALMQALPMSFQALFELYVGKNVLNRFRQANGYADGSYRKLWNGREDNVHLLEVAAELRPEQPDYLEALHAALAARYAAPA